jgi:uncharacterized protein
MALRNIVGSVAEGGDFFDREREMDGFWSDLETDSILLLAPRRVGKTSVMKRMLSDAESRDRSAIFVDVSDCEDELAFVRRLYAEVLGTNLGDRLWSKVSDNFIARGINRISKVGGAGFSLEWQKTETDWQRLGEDLAAAIGNLDGNWVIQIDELPVFTLKLLEAGESTPNKARIRQFLYWFRRVRLAYPQVKWMLAGSIGLDTITARLGLSDTINDLRIVRLGAFPRPTAEQFVHALCASYEVKLGPGCLDRILERVGWLAPYYLQLVFKQIRDRDKLDSPADVDAAIDGLLRPEYKTHFDYWRQRLVEELGAIDSTLAALLLSAAAKDEDGVTAMTLSQVLSSRLSDPESRANQLRYLLDVLQNDGYLVEDSGRYRFRFALLREYWLRRVVAQEA